MRRAASVARPPGAQGGEVFVEVRREALPGIRAFAPKGQAGIAREYLPGGAGRATRDAAGGAFVLRRMGPFSEPPPPCAPTRPRAEVRPG